MTMDDYDRYVEELHKLGAQISVDGKIAVVDGVDHLTAGTIQATDLRAGAAMVIAALCADGVTNVEEIQHIERGYEDMEGKLSAVGADIKRVHVPDETEIMVG